MITPLLAFSLGILIEKGIPNPLIVRTVIREPGPPLEFKIQVRTKEKKTDEWQYLEDNQFSVFPSNLKTSAAGRYVTVRLPGAGLKYYAQICAFYEPKPDPDKRFQALISLQSCQNVPRSNLDLIFSSPQL